jgi:hypothetical protein
LFFFCLSYVIHMTAKNQRMWNNSIDQQILQDSKNLIAPKFGKRSWTRNSLAERRIWVPHTGLSVVCAAQRDIQSHKVQHQYLPEEYPIIRKQNLVNHVSWPAEPEIRKHTYGFTGVTN